jgi:hypothetical protein
VRDLLRSLQERERLVQLAAVHAGPRLGEERAEREVRELRGEDRHLAEDPDDVVVALVAQGDLGARHLRLEHVELVVAEDVRDGGQCEAGRGSGGGPRGRRSGERRRLVHAIG